jgi:hypothetical protein
LLLLLGLLLLLLLFLPIGMSNDVVLASMLMMTMNEVCVRCEYPKLEIRDTCVRCCGMWNETRNAAEIFMFGNFQFSNLEFKTRS